jgi:hypothetical protein
MRVRTHKPNRSSMQAGIALARYWVLECPPEARLSEGLSQHLREWSKKPLVTSQRAGRGSPRHS